LALALVPPLLLLVVLLILGFPSPACCREEEDNCGSPALPCRWWRGREDGGGM
jgi:hypothetical protein